MARRYIAKSPDRQIRWRHGISFAMRNFARFADVAVIGAGPIGIEAAIGLKHAGVNYVQFEAGAIGSTIQWWAPGTRFFSSPERIEIAGVPMQLVHQDKALREEYLAYLRGVVRQFDLDIQLFTRVVWIDRVSDQFHVGSQMSTHGVGGPQEIVAFEGVRAKPQAASVWRVRKIVLAIGDMHRPRMLNVMGEDLPHVSHYLQDPHVYAGRRVLIVGGKNSAVEAALRLYRAGAHVTMSYRGGGFDPKRVKYWLRPELEWLISKGRINFHPRTLVQEITPQHVRLCSVDNQHSLAAIPADAALLLTGYVQDPSLFAHLGVELQGDAQAPRFDINTMETNIPGVYVAGTAAAGSQQRARLFIENSHIHVRRIVRDIAGVDLPWSTDEELAALEGG
jgi:thioredoxin reductase (NADPH)